MEEKSEVKERMGRYSIPGMSITHACMQSFGAHHVPNYTAQALCAHGKRAVSRLTSRFRVAFYCGRVDLVCD